MQPIRTLRQGFSFILADWTAKRILLLLLLAVISEYILTDLQTPWLSIEGMKKNGGVSRINRCHGGSGDT